MARDDRYFHVRQPGTGLDPQQRAREYRQEHRDNGWTRNERQRLRHLERRADRALRLALQPDQTSPMEIVNSLPDPTSDYLGRSLVLRTPGGFRSSVNTAIQLADDTVVWSEMQQSAIPPQGFSWVRNTSLGGSALPFSISHKSTGDLWITDQGLSALLLVSGSGGGVLTNVSIAAGYGGSGGANIGQIDVASDNVFWWEYNPGPSFTNVKLWVNNVDGSNAGSIALGSNVQGIIGSSARAVALNPTRTVIYVGDDLDDEIERWSNGGSRLGAFGEVNVTETPAGIDLDSAGDIWVSDFNNHVVRKYSGSTFAYAGVMIGSFGFAGNAPGQFSNPMGLHVDATDRLFVCDTGNSRVQVFNLSGGFLAAFGSAGGGDEQLNSPRDVTVIGSTPTAVISIADYSNHRICQWEG